MSRDDRDQRGGHPQRAGVCHPSCGWCVRNRIGKDWHPNRTTRKREWQKEVNNA